MMPIFVSHKEWISKDLPFALRIDNLKGHVLPHCHNYIEFNFTINGTATEKINGKEHILKPGNFTLLFPHHIHEIQLIQGESVSMYVGSIRIESFYDRNGAFLALAELLSNAALDNTPYHYFNEEITTDMTNILKSMLSELTKGQKWSELMFKSKLAELLITFDRNRINGDSRLKGKHMLSRNSGVWDIITYVSLNYQEDISLKTLSERFHMSTSNISASFHQLLGENFHRYLEKIRLAQACDLLLSTDSSVIDICFEAGFKSYKTFSRVFYQNFNLSPTEYRKFRTRPVNLV
ncbi:AraC family transcriptional regulator [Anaerocolumna sp. AGMB13025]|uniref:helix-turn-helix domain-containing protein n=1 Tax=Anaerocolumna sp. AGMB13025 TaxID=3039116 RepID=UPI00241C9132|nr:AraC family transcriptional regulator [Anaerocolumna sp. AGMB13025]WFR55661.1 AraC family transcriptional regulator [Anaerocolumna sp. AGMB13025]